MATFSFNPFSSESRLSQWNKHLQQREYSSDITSAIKTQTNAYRTEIQKARKDVKSSLDAATKAQADAISAASEVIVGSLEGGFLGLSEGLSGISEGVSEIQSSISDVGRMLDWRLTMLIDQQRVSNLLLGNVALLLRIPDVQKERQYHIEQGFKHYKNAAIDGDLYQDAIENLLEAEKREKADYVVLHRIGMLYLYAPKLLDLPKAEDYFKRAAKYAVVESDPNAMRVFNVLAGDVTQSLTEQSMSWDAVKRVAADSYFQAGIACYAQEKYSLAAELSNKAFCLTPTMLEARFVQAKAICSEGNEDRAAEVLEGLISAAPFYSVKTVTDLELAPKAPIKAMLVRLRDDAVARATQTIERCKAAMIPSSEAKPLVLELELLLQRNSYLGAIATLIGLTTLRRWSFANEEALKQPPLCRTAKSVVFTRDGAGLVQANGIEIVIFDLFSGTETRWIETEGQIGSISLNPAGTIMVQTGYSGPIIELRDFPSSAAIRQMRAPSDGVNSVAFSPDGAMLVSGGDDNIVRLWDVLSGTEIRCMSGHSTPVISVAFSPSGQELASVGQQASPREPGDAIRLWNTMSGQEIRRLGKSHIFLMDKPQLMPFTSIAFSPDGKILGAASAHGVTLWDFASGAEIRSFKACSSQIVFSPDGQIAASNNIAGKDEDQTIILWEVASGKEIRRLSGHSHGIRDLAFSPDGQLLASAGPTVRLWRNEHLSVETFIRVEKNNAENRKRAEAKKQADEDRMEAEKREKLARELELKQRIGHLLDSASAEESKQSKKWFGKDYRAAIALYEQAAALGSEGARDKLKILRK